MTSVLPKVFVSYSHDTVKHQERVLGFVDRLRADGIDAEIDQYNAAPPGGWPLWCERQIEAADVVLMVCTETYHRRVSGDEESGKGLGVFWEAQIIRQLLYDAGFSDKFVPVLFSDNSPEQIPTPIKGGTRYVVDTEDGYEDLYRRLTGQPRLLRPALGKIRPLPTRSRQWPEGTMEATSSPLNLRSSMEIAALATSLVASFMIPLIKKGVESLAGTVGEKAGQEAVSAMRRIWDRVSGAFSEPDEQAALRLFKDDPESTKPVIESILKKKLAEDPVLARELEALVSSPAAESATRIIAETVGYVDARGANISGGVIGGIVGQLGSGPLTGPASPRPGLNSPPPDKS